MAPNTAVEAPTDTNNEPCRKALMRLPPAPASSTTDRPNPAPRVVHTALKKIAPTMALASACISPACKVSAVTARHSSPCTMRSASALPRSIQGNA